MHVNAAGRDDLTFARDHFGSRPNNYVHVRLHIRIAGFPDGSNTPVLNGDVGFYNSPVIQDQRIGDDRINGALTASALRLAHTVADDFSTAELYLFTINCEVLLRFNGKVSIREAHLVPDGRSKHLRVCRAADFVRHSQSPPCSMGTELGAVYLLQWAHNRLIESIHHPRTHVWDQRNFTRLARLEAHSGSRRNVQAISASCLPIKGESWVGLGEVIVTADLD